MYCHELLQVIRMPFGGGSKAKTKAEPTAYLMPEEPMEEVCGLCL